MTDALYMLWQSTGIANVTLPQLVMIAVGGGLLYLAIARRFEPLLLVPIGFGCVLSNIPVAGIGGPDGLLGMLYSVGLETGIFPLLIFMGVGALTDFSALIARPSMLLLGAAAQFGIFGTPARCDCGCSLLLHGTGADHSATHHARFDDRSRACAANGPVAHCQQT